LSKNDRLRSFAATHGAAARHDEKAQAIELLEGILFTLRVRFTQSPVSHVLHNPLVQRSRPEAVLINTTPIEESLRKLQRSGVSKSAIARQLSIGRTSVRPILASSRRKQ